MAIMPAAGAITSRREMSKHATTDVTWCSHVGSWCASLKRPPWSVRFGWLTSEGQFGSSLGLDEAMLILAAS